MVWRTIDAPDGTRHVIPCRMRASADTRPAWYCGSPKHSRLPGNTTTVCRNVATARLRIAGAPARAGLITKGVLF
jgi:hypothetical protein